MRSSLAWIVVFAVAACRSERAPGPDPIEFPFAVKAQPLVVMEFVAACEYRQGYPVSQLKGPPDTVVGSLGSACSTSLVVDGETFEILGVELLYRDQAPFRRFVQQHVVPLLKPRMRRLVEEHVLSGSGEIGFVNVRDGEGSIRYDFNPTQLGEDPDKSRYHLLIHEHFAR